LIQVLLQSIRDFAQGEPTGSSPGDHIGYELIPAARAFGLILRRGPVGDECSGALLGIEDAPNFEFSISAQNGIGVNLQVDSDLPDGRELVAPGKLARR
jgi:hypothetical protein